MVNARKIRQWRKKGIITSRRELREKADALERERRLRKHKVRK